MNFFKSFFETSQQSPEEKSLIEAHTEFRNTVPFQKVVVWSEESPKTWRFFDLGDSTKDPVICIPPAGGSADIFFKLFNELPTKGIRLIAVQNPSVYSHDEWIDSFKKFLNQIKIGKVHILGCGLGGFLGLLFTRVFPERVLSIILINSYSENTSFLDSTYKFKFVPAFILRQVLYKIDNAVPFSAKNLASMNFFKEHMEDLDQQELFSALSLQCSKAFIDRRRINTTTLTVIESEDYSSFPPVVRSSLSNSFPSSFISKVPNAEPSTLCPACFVPLKKGGDFPFLSEDEEISHHITLHMKRLEEEKRGEEEERRKEEEIKRAFENLRLKEKKELNEQQREEEEKKCTALLLEAKKNIVEPITNNIIKKTMMCYENFNSTVPENDKEFLKRRIEKKKQSSLLQDQLILDQLGCSIEEKKKKFEQMELSRFIPNPCVQEEVELFKPISLNQIVETKKILDKKINSIEDPNAVFQVVNGIAEENNLQFVIVNSKEEKKDVSLDIYRKPIDTALENDSITENTFHLLGSDVPGHNVKGFSLHLDGSLSDIPESPDDRNKYEKKIKTKLAELHQVPVSSIIIHSLTEGFQVINYTVKDNKNIDISGTTIKKLFPKYLKCDVYPSFLCLRMDASSFDTRYNRDFSIDSNCVKGESRGCQPYNPPAGWFRYGLNVSGKYDNGDDTWLGMENITGEWCVAYHGTAHSLVNSILLSPLGAGPNNAFGRGIYCSPVVSTAEGYCKSTLELDTTQGKQKYKYVFMCRVNVSNIHRCTTSPCREAENPLYTVHFTTSNNYWFVNLNNTKYENIRQYGILIKRA